MKWSGSTECRGASRVRMHPGTLLTFHSPSPGRVTVAVRMPNSPECWASFAGAKLIFLQAFLETPCRVPSVVWGNVRESLVRFVFRWWFAGSWGASARTPLWRRPCVSRFMTEREHGVHVLRFILPYASWQRLFRNFPSMCF